MGPSLKAFGAARVVLGAGSWLAPDRTTQLFGLGEGGSSVVTRLFGIRDALLGGALLDPSPTHRRRALQAGVVCDVVDVAATVVGVRKGDIGVRGALLLGGGATLFAALGVIALGHEPAALGRP